MVIKESQANPELEGPMDRTVIGKLAGQLIPLGAAAQAGNDRIQGRPGVNVLAPSALGRVIFVQQRLDLLPQVLRHSLDRRQLVGLRPFAVYRHLLKHQGCRSVYHLLF